MAYSKDEENFEPELIAVKQFLTRLETKEITPAVRDWIKRHAKNFYVNDNKLYRKTIHGLRIVLPINERENVLRTFHDQMGHWDVETTKQFILER